MRGIERTILAKIEKESPKSWSEFMEYVDNFQRSSHSWITGSLSDPLPFELWPFEFQIMLFMKYCAEKLEDKDTNIMAELKADIDTELAGSFAEIEENINKTKTDTDGKPTE